MTHKNSDQVKEEITALLAVKPKVKKLSFFGDDNHAGIDAQVDVLTQCLNSDQVHDKYLEGNSHIFFEALYASDWLHGLVAQDEDAAPSVGWQSLTE